MQIWQAFVLGVIEGLTEFLPVSSTFHLIFASQLLHLENTDFLKLFEVFIQAGAILAVLLLYGRELMRDFNLIKKLIISFIPTAIIGYLLHSIIKNFFFETSWLMIGAFLIVGLIFILYEWHLRNKQQKINQDIQDLSTWQSFLIGLGQALAVVPGVSRSGSVIITMMLMGQKRSSAAKYSFLLALPTICSAAALDLLKFETKTGFSSQELMVLLIGTVTAFLVSILVLKWFIKFIQNNTLTSFGVYRIVLVLMLGIFL